MKTFDSEIDAQDTRRNCPKCIDVINKNIKIYNAIYDERGYNMVYLSLNDMIRNNLYNMELLEITSERLDLTKSFCSEHLKSKYRRGKNPVTIDVSQTIKPNKKIPHKHGLSGAEAKKLRNDHGNICELCSSFSIKMAVDHCHTTGKIRGIICFGCNLGLGAFKDDINRLELAIKYLKERNGKKDIGK